ncbi:hypothetical protein [Bradyrhizobium sp. RDM4]|uniref:hypothetical protein n=1 Tax=Bradyrhizobium sp. RDM4 TaxID=3378765 RepID=UPI0038FCB87C
MTFAEYHRIEATVILTTAKEGARSIDAPFCASKPEAHMQVVKILGTSLKHALSPGELAKAKNDILADIAHAKAVRRTIGAEGHPLESAIANYLSCPKVKLACAFQAASKKSERHRPSLNMIIGIPGELNPDQPLQEMHRLTVKQKKSGSGDLRFIRDYGPLHRTGQLMVHHVVERLIVPQAWQKTFKGLPHIVGSAKTALMAGKVFGATLDIENHYGSFSTKGLPNLLLAPQEWVENVVGARHASVSDVKAPPQCILPVSKLILLAQSGLPLGSICSPMIAAYSVSFLNWTPNPQRILLNYADNFLLLASSSQALSEGISEVMAAVRKLPAGKFKLKVQSEGNASDGFDFLGHHLQLLQDKVLVEPSQWNVEAIYSDGNKMGAKVATALKKWRT